MMLFYYIIQSDLNGFNLGFGIVEGFEDLILDKISYFKSSKPSIVKPYFKSLLK